MISFLQELGPTWSWFAVVLMLFSAFMRTYLLIAFASGIAITLYLHPAATEGPTSRSHVLQRSREVTDSLSTRRSMSDDVFKSMNNSVRIELEYFLDHVINNYIGWWYQPPVFPTENSFPMACKQTLKYSIGQLYSSLSHKDPVFYFDALFTNCVATLGVVLTELRGAIKLKSKDDPSGLQAFARKNPESLLARLLNSSESQANSKCCAHSILRYCVKPEDMNCKIVSILMTQILATLIIDKTLSSTAHKDFLNKVIVDYYNQAHIAKDTVTQQRLAEQFEYATQEIVHTVEATQSTQASGTININRDSESANTVQLSEIVIPGDDIAPRRGRRLSFKHRSMGSLGEISESPSSDAGDAGKKHYSFLKRTSSLLSRSSRSRSRSPVKSGPESEQVSIRPRDGLQPIAHPARALFQATILAYDASDIPTTMSVNDPITSAIVPKFTIMISPKKPDKVFNSQGVCIMRSIFDVEDLDTSLRYQRSGQACSINSPTDWRGSTYSLLEARINKYLTSIVEVEDYADDPAFHKFCSPDFVSVDRSDPKTCSNLNAPSLISLGSSFSDGSKNLFGSLKKGVMFGSKSLYDSVQLQENTSIRSQSSRQQADRDRRIEALEQEGPSSSNDVGTIATPSTRSRDIGLKSEASSGAQSHTNADFSQKTKSRLDFQSLISQSMELLTAFFSLSARTWTIRKQLLNLLRNLLLSKNSAYAFTLQSWLEEMLFEPLSDPTQVARRLHQFNSFMFSPNSGSGHMLSAEESRLLAEEARHLILQKAMPPAIKNLMGVDCVHEALGIVFDAMQEQEFSEGLLSILFTESLRLLLID